MARPAYSADKREEIESRIKETALALFGSQGYRNVSLRAIASEMGLSAPALYRYFDNKNALLGALRADGFRYLKKTLADVRETAVSPVEAVSEAMKAYLNFAITQSALYCLMYELDQESIEESSLASASRKRAFSEAEGMAQDAADAAEEGYEAAKEAVDDVADVAGQVAHATAEAADDVAEATEKAIEEAKKE